jgi:DNA-binding XRE family transcriptional regulator
MTKHATSPRGERRFFNLTDSAKLSSPLPNDIAHWRKKILLGNYRPMRQEDLAALVSIGAEELGRYERGERKPPMHMLFMLSAALRVPPHALYPELWKECQRKVEEKRLKHGLGISPRSHDDQLPKI